MFVANIYGWAYAFASSSGSWPLGAQGVTLGFALSLKLMVGASLWVAIRRYETNASRVGFMYRSLFNRQWLWNKVFFVLVHFGVGIPFGATDDHFFDLGNVHCLQQGYHGDRDCWRVACHVSNNVDLKRHSLPFVNSNQDGLIYSFFLKHFKARMFVLLCAINTGGNVDLIGDIWVLYVLDRRI